MATIAEIAVDNEDLEILVAALGFIDDTLGSDLIGTISDADQDLTVFAPTDAAFGQLAVDLGFEGDPADEDAVAGFLTSLQADDEATANLLNTIVTYHISAGGKTADEIAELDTVETLSDEATITPALPRLIDNEPDIIDPAVTTANVTADNGVVHLIDRVLLPLDLDGNDVPTLLGTVAALNGEAGLDDNPGDFDILAAAVGAADIGAVLDDEDSDLTVFAPTDAAFADLAAALGYDGDATDEEAVLGFVLESLTLLSGGTNPIPLLTNILTYHVGTESLIAAQVLTGDPIETALAGATIQPNGTTLEDGDPDLPDPTIVLTDVQAAGGVAHVIDGVLIPVDVLASDGADAVDFRVLGDEDDSIATGSDADLVDGNGGDDELRLGAGNDIGLGGVGEDEIRGGSGNDVIRGGEQADDLIGNQGRDTINGGHGDDDIAGGRGSDRLIGKGGEDDISGGAGNDRIFGDRADDDLTGGGGNDRFIFRNQVDDDTVTDFTSGEDVLVFRDLGFDNIGDVRDASDVVDGDLVIDLGDAGSVTLEGVTALANGDVIV